MMDNSRTRLLLGNDTIQRLEKANILVAGTGGVGAYVTEMLVRAGIGKLTIIDADHVQPSNLNRQLCALHSTIGKQKVDVLATRLKDINPNLQLTTKAQFIQPNNIPPLLDNNTFNFIVDAIDTLTPKCTLIAEALKRHIKIISSMGAGAKTDITQIHYADISQTHHCPLSKAVRQQLKNMGIHEKLTVVFSTQQPNKQAIIPTHEQGKTTTVGTVSYMPAAFACFLACHVINNL